jgi:hypothetical protein
MDLLAAWNSVKRPTELGGGATTELVLPTSPAVVKVA